MSSTSFNRCRYIVWRGVALLTIVCAMSACKPTLRQDQSGALVVKPPAIPFTPAAPRNAKPPENTAAAPERPRPFKLPALTTGIIQSIRFTPDGRRLVFDNGLAVAAIDLKHARLLWNISARGFTETLMMTRDGQRIVIPTTDPDLETPTTICTIGGRIVKRLHGYVDRSRISGHYLVRSDMRPLDDGSHKSCLITEVWDLRTGRRTDRYTGPQVDDKTATAWYDGEVKVPAITTSGKVVTASARRRSNVAEASTDEIASTYHSGRFAFYLNGYEDAHPGVEVWDTLTNKRIWGAVYVQSIPRGAAISPDGRVLTVVGTEHIVRFFNLKTGRQIAKTRCGFDLMRTVAYSPNGRVVAVAGGDFYNYGASYSHDGIILLDTRTYRPLASINVECHRHDRPAPSRWYIQTTDGSFTASPRALSEVSTPDPSRLTVYLKRYHRPENVREALRLCWSKLHPQVTRHR